MPLGNMGKGISAESERVAKARLKNPEIQPKASIQIANALAGKDEKGNDKKKK